MNSPITEKDGDLNALTDVDIHDRVMEAYYGLLGESFMKETQERIHWICSQVSGNHVMDVGCSQGIVPILLAREGCKVTGVDISPRAIEEASSYVAREPEHVRTNIRFINQDFISMDTSSHEVDTLVLSEVLEHLVRPEIFVAKAAEILSRQNGKLIVTVPFGINDFIDHKQTFYLAEPYQLLAERFGKIEYTILGKWIGLTASQPGESASIKEPGTRFLSDVEAGFYRLEQTLRDTIKVQSRQLSDSRNRTKGLQASLEQANLKYRDANAQIASLKQVNDEKGHKIRELEKLAVQADRVAELEQQLEAEQRVSVGRHRELKALSTQLEKANRKYRELTLQVDQARELQQRANQLNRELKLEREQKVAAQRSLSVIRSSRTFKAGHYLGAARGSVRDAIKLPVRLWRLRKQSVKPQLLAQEEKPKNTVELAPASSIDHVGLSTANLAQTPAKQVRMACIMDDFTYGSYQPECDLLQLTPGGWEQELEQFQPQVLFIESAWRGKDELWGSKVGHCSQELQGIVAWCRERHIPTIFWNKEDPVHFETFLTTAQLFDFVFTTDMDCIHRYKAALGHDHVYFLPFACQPTAHNPIEKYERKDAFCFAGAYYARYPERTRDLESFVKELSDHRPFDIYDRNYGKNDPNYRFPQAYQAHIVGTLPFSEIDKAYKGYHYAINLNSIKQSQTMFARRVYELLGSNTLTISNYSRGVRLLFGDLVITSDSGSEIRNRLEVLQSEGLLDRIRLAGLRKVMSEHTYADRINYVLEKVTRTARSNVLPTFTVIALVQNKEDAQAVIDNAARQNSVEVRLLLVCDKELEVSAAQRMLDNSMLSGQAMSTEALGGQTLGQLSGDGRWVSAMCPLDYYGPNYLIDMALATRYSDAQVIGKAAYYRVSEQGDLVQQNSEKAYSEGEVVYSRRAVIHPALARTLSADEWIRSCGEWVYRASGQLSIDGFNYCEGAGANPALDVTTRVDDVQVNHGVALSELTPMAEAIKPMKSDLEHAPWLDGAQFTHVLLGESFTWLNGQGLASSKDEERSVKLSRNSAISARLTGPLLEIDSQLPDEKHEYVYGSGYLPLQELRKPLGAFEGDRLPLHLQTDPGLNLSLVVIYLDAKGKRLGHDIVPANRNASIRPVDGAEQLRLGLRVYAGGSCRIHRLILGQLELEPSDILGESDVLLLTNHYPSYDDLYRNGFVHTRVKAYRERGARVDVFRLRKGEPINWHEFQDVDVTTGSQHALRRMLGSGKYRHVLVHFLDSEMWEVLEEFIDTIKVTVWVHGAEVQPWWRREYNYSNETELEEAKAESDERLTFWKGLFTRLPHNLRFVFVSRYFADEVIQDVGVPLPESHYQIIHNPVDTALFSYIEKGPEQRKKILSIRPYASRKYANDLSVQAVLELSKESFFEQLEFKFVGDGALFDETLAPLAKFDNVEIQRGFLSQNEIASLHKEYGLFLCPTRMDAQGVSKDEAMSSGLIPITNGVTAIPEFVDASCGVLAEPEDYSKMAKGIKDIYLSGNLFQSMSKAAANRARRQVCKNKIRRQEMALFKAEVQ